MSNNTETIQCYLASLSPMYRKGHEIAQQQLGSSYDVTKSIGFVNWEKKQQIDRSTENVERK